MIKFFRKIRYGLMENNKTGKYFKYAIGEIILVVIGILIAIQLNSVKQNNDKRTEEINYLKNILSDLNQDKVELEKIIERRKSKANSAKTMESYYHTNNVENLSEYYSNWTNVLFWEAHNPSFITFKELINSGKLSSLSNESIKQLLLKVDYSYNELFEIRKHMYDDYSDYLYKPFADIIDYENAIITWSKPNTNINLSREDVEIALKNKRIKNGFTLAAFNNNLLKEQASEILTKVDSTIVLVKIEIEK
jgi:hypothetical protein